MKDIQDLVYVYDYMANQERVNPDTLMNIIPIHLESHKTNGLMGILDKTRLY